MHIQTCLIDSHERIEDTAFRQAVDLLDAGDITGLRAHLKHHPKLVDQHIPFEVGNYFRNPTLLEFVAENPVRRGVLPANIVQVAKVILDLLCDYGADPNTASMLLSCTASSTVSMLFFDAVPESTPRLRPLSGIRTISTSFSQRRTVRSATWPWPHSSVASR